MREFGGVITEGTKTVVRTEPPGSCCLLGSGKMSWEGSCCLKGSGRKTLKRHCASQTSEKTKAEVDVLMRLLWEVMLEEMAFVRVEEQDRHTPPGVRSPCCAERKGKHQEG